MILFAIDDGGEVGLTLGDIDILGKADGLDEGRRLGILLGVTDGNDVGSGLGRRLGNWLGFRDGVKLGLDDGQELGLKLGSDDATTDGCELGTNDGVELGESSHSLMFFLCRIWVGKVAASDGSWLSKRPVVFPP